MSIYVTGDTHGNIDTSKLNNYNFKDYETMTKNDYIMVAGDFGFVWSGGKEEQQWLKWFENKNFTTLFVDGNHENFDLLDEYPVEIWNGGKIHRINDSVIHLMRGQVFELQGHKFFTFGGGFSIDKSFRKEGISWWKQEMPTADEYAEGLINLTKHDNKVDFIITHTCDMATKRFLGMKMLPEEEDGIGGELELNYYLESINKNVKFMHWYFGHFHMDNFIDDKQTAIYDQIIRIV